MRTFLMKFVYLFIATLLAFTNVWGQSKVSPFTANYVKKHHSVTRSVTGNEVVSAYLHTEGTPDVTALEAVGVRVNQQLDEILTVRMPLSAIPLLEQFPFVKYIQMGTPVRPMMDKARAVGGVDRVHAAEGLDIPYTGKGVVVGIIDGGFDYTHPAFVDDETGILRIKRVWEQGSTGGTVPAAFGYGIELTTEEAILAAKADVTTQSHGTHVASMAAGAYRVTENPYYGIASDADIVLVSKGAITANSANISDAIAYIYNYADSVGKPCVVNMSLGWHLGPHDGTSPFDQVADQLQGPGRVLVGSIGNYGNDAVHVGRVFTGADDAPLQAMVAFKKDMEPSVSNVGGEIDIWADKGMELDLKLTIAAKRDGSDAFVMDTLDMASPMGVTKEYTFPSKYASGSILVSTEVNPLNGKPHAFITSNLTSINGARYNIGIVLVPRSAGTVHAWTDAVYTTFDTEVPAGWAPGDKEHTLCEIGGTGREIISVGAFVTRTDYNVLGSSQTKYTDEKMGALATFSSVGPTIDGRMKPEVVAPGTFIASAVNSHDSYRSNYPTASAVVWNEKNYNYSYMQGTSMAAPFVSGVVATWLQADPTLDSETIRQVLASTAVNDEFTNPATCGYGKIDAYAGLKAVLARVAGIDEMQAEASSQAFVTRRTAEGWQLCFTRPVGLVGVALYDASGICLFQCQSHIAEAGAMLAVPSKGLATGLYLLRVNDSVVKVGI